ncbi:AraC family transcriptional regulator [Methylophaga lonarensis MPL]|uniref:AraC family transcriptional regulator n=1 Tax=Methylophaga lonarensis MPL TaxID=1286106 RepID=M7P3C6_9GAMM|nr:helix-turn-helix domain-containing protein [Methylophaga lonarensis]EMR14017.1 AraC family transcriptional regulator [Methylophaga lonarensis MPL]
MSFREPLYVGPVHSEPIHVVQLTSDDVLAQAEALPFWSQEYTQLDKGEFSGAVTSVSCHGVQLFRETMNRAVDEIASAPANSYVVGLPTIIEGTASWGLQPLSRDSLITLDKNTELMFRTSHLSEITATVIAADRLEAYAEKVERVDLSKLMSKVKPVETIKPELADRLCNILIGGAQHIMDINSSEQALKIWRHLEDDLLDAVMQSLMQVSENPIRNNEHRIHRHIVNRVRELTLMNQDQMLSIGDLCRALNISRRTLNHAFTRVLGITPVAYIRNVRLQRIREELQSSAFQVTTIADVAAKWGFWHMSLFSRYYRELFGECPNETLQRSRTINI